MEAIGRAWRRASLRRRSVSFRDSHHAALFRLLVVRSQTPRPRQCDWTDFQVCAVRDARYGGYSRFSVADGGKDDDNGDETRNEEA